MTKEYIEFPPRGYGRPNWLNIFGIRIIFHISKFDGSHVKKVLHFLRNTYWFRKNSFGNGYWRRMRIGGIERTQYQTPWFSIVVQNHPVEYPVFKTKLTPAEAGMSQLFAP